MNPLRTSDVVAIQPPILSKPKSRLRSVLLSTTALTPVRSLQDTVATHPESRDLETIKVRRTLDGAIRRIALAAPSERRAAFRKSAQEVAELVAAEKLDLQAAADRLQQAAEAYDLVAEYGQDKVQFAIAEAMRNANGWGTNNPVGPTARHEPRTSVAPIVYQGLEVTRASDIEPRPIAWLWPQRISLGKLMLIAGEPGLGKSQITAHLASVVSRGGEWPNGEGMCPQGKVLIFSAEDDPADTIRPRLEAAGANLKHVLLVGGVREGNHKGSRGFDLCKDLHRLEDTLKSEKEIRLVVIDPLNAYTGFMKFHDASHMRQMLMPLQDLAARYDVAVVAIMHLNKANTQGNALHRILGSGALVAAARSVHMVLREKNTDRRMFVPAKNNLGSDDIGGLVYRIETKVIQGNICTPYVVWEDEIVHESADEILSASADGAEAGSALAEAKEFLQEMLSRGPIEAREIQQEAASAGVSERTLKRAKSSLKIKARRTGGLGAAGRWVWFLPSDDKETKATKQGYVGQAKNVVPLVSSGPHRNDGVGATCSVPASSPGGGDEK